MFFECNRRSRAGDVCVVLCLCTSSSEFFPCDRFPVFESSGFSLCIYTEGRRGTIATEQPFIDTTILGVKNNNSNKYILIKLRITEYVFIDLICRHRRAPSIVWWWWMVYNIRRRFFTVFCITVLNYFPRWEEGGTTRRIPRPPLSCRVRLVRSAQVETDRQRVSLLHVITSIDFSARVREGVGERMRMKEWEGYRGWVGEKILLRKRARFVEFNVLCVCVCVCVCIASLVSAAAVA